MAFPIAPTSTPSAPAPGSANTFGSLKSLFKTKYPSQKKCKVCGQMFTPKQKQAVAIAESHKPVI